MSPAPARRFFEGWRCCPGGGGPEQDLQEVGFYEWEVMGIYDLKHEDFKHQPWGSRFERVSLTRRPRDYFHEQEWKRGFEPTETGISISR